jgi:hypothetical protein
MLKLISQAVKGECVDPFVDPIAPQAQLGRPIWSADGAIGSIITM